MGLGISQWKHCVPGWVQADLWIPRAKRLETPVSAFSYNRDCYGGLIQIEWLNTMTGLKDALLSASSSLVFIDDATSGTMYSIYASVESVNQHLTKKDFNTFVCLSSMVSQSAFYSDKHSVSRVNQSSKERYPRLPSLDAYSVYPQYRHHSANSPLSQSRVNGRTGTPRTV